MNEIITIEKQVVNNVIDESNSKNYALEEQKRNETLEYAKRHFKQRID